MEARIAELEASLRRWRVVSVVALVVALVSIVWTGVNVLMAPETPVHADANDAFQPAGMRRRQGGRRPAIGPNGQRRRGPRAQGGNQAEPAEEPDNRESPPPAK